MRFRDILDGLSNSICAGEIATDLGDNDIRTRAAVNASNIWLADGAVTCDTFIDPLRPTFWSATTPFAIEPTAVGTGPEQRRGFRWALGRGMFCNFNTIVPPNNVVCMEDNTFNAGILPPSSRHQGGSHVLLTDGAIKFVTDSIKAGNRRSAQVGLVAGMLAPGLQSP